MTIIIVLLLIFDSLQESDAVQTQLATLPVLKREVPISQPHIRHYGLKLGRPFRQPFRHIITHHKHWIFWIINDHNLLIHNTCMYSNNSISHYIDINNYFNYITYIYLFIYNANLLGTGLSMLGFKMGSFPLRNGKLPILKLPIFKTSNAKKLYVCV